jgi:glycosyltransferase involved in cell wall biosynthesis
VLTTIHGFSSPRIIPVFKKYNARCGYVAISDADRHPDLDYLATIRHGIDTNAFTLNASAGDYLLFFGCIHPDKGAVEAIDVAARSGLPLVMAGIIQDQAYFDSCISPRLDNEQIRYIGSVGTEERDALLGGPTPCSISSTSWSPSASASSKLWPAGPQSWLPVGGRCRS